MEKRGHRVTIHKHKTLAPGSLVRSLYSGGSVAFTRPRTRNNDAAGLTDTFFVGVVVASDTVTVRNNRGDAWEMTFVMSLGSDRPCWVYAESLTDLEASKYG